MLWVTVISNFTNFQVETSITIEQLLPSSIDSENPEVVKKSVLIYVFITVSYALIGSLVFNIILLPKSCNENPDTPIMKLEYQIQEWWNSKLDRYETFGFGFVGCFLFLITNSMPVFILKKSTLLTLGTILMISVYNCLYAFYNS